MNTIRLRTSPFYRFVTPAIFLFVFVFLFLAAGAEAASPQDAQRLYGRWMRPDGGYILELNSGKDGNLQAGYYNPRPINVSRAELHRDGDQLSIFIELRDINYPGSTYTLRYEPATDRLQGIYFQAAEQQRYEVIFTRSR